MKNTSLLGPFFLLSFFGSVKSNMVIMYFMANTHLQVSKYHVLLGLCHLTQGLWGRGNLKSPQNSCYSTMAWFLDLSPKIYTSTGPGSLRHIQALETVFWLSVFQGSEFCEDLKHTLPGSTLRVPNTVGYFHALPS